MSTIENDDFDEFIAFNENEDINNVEFEYGTSGNNVNENDISKKVIKDPYDQLIENIELCEDNIFYYFINNEIGLVDIINEILDISTESLYVIRILRENLFDKFVLCLQKSELLFKHKYIFIDENLPKIAKCRLLIKDFTELVDIRNSIPNFKDTFFKSSFLNSLYSQHNIEKTDIKEYVVTIRIQ